MLNHAHLRDRFPPELLFQRYRFRFARYKRCDRYSMTPALTHSRDLSVRETSHVKYEAPDFARRVVRVATVRNPRPTVGTASSVHQTRTASSGQQEESVRTTASRAQRPRDAVVTVDVR